MRRGLHSRYGPLLITRIAKTTHPQRVKGRDTTDGVRPAILAIETNPILDSRLAAQYCGVAAIEDKDTRSQLKRTFRVRFFKNESRRRYDDDDKASSFQLAGIVSFAFA